ncbi:hypothetical protein [Janthinobacterium sp. FW305-128]|uniref:hypothetical protein n=1 Tax=Janthinobacterium sp. FW305-128 TaxID=2775055 RepID=UPI001E390FBC|nr:hypothetical protein [Janthinobacterium sp. FW305-128]
MLINIAQSFTENLKNVDEKFINEFEELISIHRKMNHYVSISRKTSKIILEEIGNRISERTKVSIAQISGQSDSSIAILKNIEYYIEIRFCHPIGLIIEETKNNICWVCSIEYVNQWCSQPLRIIGEHITDGKTCLEAAKHYSMLNSLPHQMQKATVEMSGGCGNANIVLGERLTDATAPILCAIDSDKLTKNHAGSAAIKKCKTLIKNKPGIAVFRSTDAREFENILPLNYVRAAIQEMDNTSNRDDILANIDKLLLIKRTKKNIYEHIDLKNGTCFTWINSQSKDVKIHYTDTPIIGPCKCNENCTGFISPPIIQTMLDKTLEIMQKGSKREIEKLIDISDDVAWLSIGRSVFSLALSNNARLT